MTTLQKIEKLNKKCDETLSFCHYEAWEIHSFRVGSPLSMEKHYPFFKADTLKEVVDLAYKFVFENEI